MSITGQTVTINGGDQTTASQSVTLTLTAKSSTGASITMLIYNEDASSAGWVAGNAVAYAATQAWQLSEGTGAKTVTVWFSDGAGPAVACTANIVVDPNQQEVDGSWLLLKMQDYSLAGADNTASTGTTYLRLGAPAPGETNWIIASGNQWMLAANSKTPAVSPGWFEYTDGDQTVLIMGDKKENVNNYELVAGGSNLLMNETRTVETGHVSTLSYFSGDKEEFFAGYTIDAQCGLGIDLLLGGKLDVTVGCGVDCFAGYKLELGAWSAFSSVKDMDLRVAREFQHKAHERVRLRVRPDSTGRDRWETAALVALGMGVTSATIGAAAAQSGPAQMNPSIVMGTTIAGYAVAIVASLFAAYRERRDKGRSRAEINMTADGVRIDHMKADGDVAAELVFGAIDLPKPPSSAAATAPAGTAPARSPGHILLKSTDGPSLKMDPAGNAILDANKNLSLQVDGTCVVLDHSGRMKLEGEEMFLKGTKVDVLGILVVKS